MEPSWPQVSLAGTAAGAAAVTGGRQARVEVPSMGQAHRAAENLGQSKNAVPPALALSTWHWKPTTKESEVLGTLKVITITIKPKPRSASKQADPNFPPPHG